jgi:hypothetical protein
MSINPQLTKSQIEAGFLTPRKILRRGAIVIPAKMVNLNKAAEAAIENDQDQDEVDNADPGIVYEKLGWLRTPLLHFCWQSGGPMVCETHLELLHIDDNLALACLTQEAGPMWQAFLPL